MSIQPSGEEIRKAVKWIMESCKAEPDKEMRVFINEACVKFDLSPMDAEFLERNIRNEISGAECKS